MTEQVSKPLFVEVALWGVDSRGRIAPYTIWNECDLDKEQQGFATYFAFKQEDAIAWMKDNDNHLAGFQAKAKLKPVMIPIDIDSLDLDFALSQARQIEKKLTGLGLAHDIYFSGGKGFHVHISSKPFNVDFNVQAGKITAWVVDQLVWGTNVIPCRSIYRNNQLLRLPGSYHSKGYFKKLIPSDMLHGESIDQIREYCRNR